MFFIPFIKLNFNQTEKESRFNPLDMHTTDVKETSEQKYNQLVDISESIFHISLSQDEKDILKNILYASYSNGIELNFGSLIRDVQEINYLSSRNVSNLIQFLDNMRGRGIQ